MLHLDLTPEDVNILIETLESAICDLRMEVANTDNVEYRAMLKNRERALKQVLLLLKTAPQPHPAQV